MQVGFGPGNLRRNHDSTVRVGAPYMIGGREQEPYGILRIDSEVFDYEDPGKNLTFYWFKHNIMCRDNAWICKETKTTKKGKEQKGQGSGSASSGSKKNRRKNQNKNGKRNKGKIEFKRRM